MLYNRYAMDKSKLKYCFIDINYLSQIFETEVLEDRKYETRPFIYISDLKIAIAFPEVTNHKKPKKYWDNFYFDNDNHYLSVSSFIYVPTSAIILDESWSNKAINIAKLDEINNRLDELIKVWLNVVGVLKNNQEFKDKHKYISLSKAITFKQEGIKPRNECSSDQEYFAQFIMKKSKQ